MTETEKETIGRRYMALAVQYGHIEIQQGLSLCTTAWLVGMGINENELKSFFPDGAFYFVDGKIITECLDPFHVMEYTEGEAAEAAYGHVLPIAYK
jgi:hypothetical protein